ncbi:MAG: type II toxin-antitoxin system VapC family toxin [Opitutaceae bacterium]
MRTALDSSVILDVVIGDPRWADASEAVLRESLSLGNLLINECVLAEIMPAFAPGDLVEFMNDWRIVFVPSSRSSAERAGEMYRAYLERGGKAKRVLPDFLIGSHAGEHADRLVARDRGYYRDYFTDLLVVEPTRRT